MAPQLRQYERPATSRTSPVDAITGDSGDYYGPQTPYVDLRPSPVISDSRQTRNQS
jgi:hypothetical protein